MQKKKLAVLMKTLPWSNFLRVACDPESCFASTPYSISSKPKFHSKVYTPNFAIKLILDLILSPFDHIFATKMLLNPNSHLTSSFTEFTKIRFRCFQLLKTSAKAPFRNLRNYNPKLFLKFCGN